MSQESYKNDISQYVDDVWEDVISDLKDLVAIESVENLDEAKPGEPWGHAPRQALDCALAIADKLGLKTTCCDGYLGFAEVDGKDNKNYIATIAHTDVVPVGAGWTFEPLKVTRKDGYLIGRGVLDDKGCAVISLYVAKFFKDRSEKTGETLPYLLRCILGNNEETSMADAEYYIEHYPQPAFIFTPDAEFPLCFGEKGGYSCWLKSAKIEHGCIKKLHGGTAGNAIPGEAYALVAYSDKTLKNTDSVSVEPYQDGLVKIVAKGIPGHASLPEGTVNAIGVLVDYLLENNLYSEEEKSFLELEKKVFASTDGSSLGIAGKDDYFTPLTHIGGTIRTENGQFIQNIDSRYPTHITGEEISQRLRELAFEHNASWELDLDMPPFLTDPKSEPIQTLLTVYREYTGDMTEPFTIGGGTYARHFERACSFGPNSHAFKKPEWVGPEHGADEGIEEEKLKLAMKIYIEAIDRLMKLDLSKA